MPKRPLLVLHILVERGARPLKCPGDMRKMKKDRARSPVRAMGIAIYTLEITLIAGLQAFIFATLSAIYIGGAIHPDH